MAAATLAILACAGQARAQDGEQKKQPPPEFSTGYRPPSPVTPQPRADLFNIVDVAVLVVVLSLTSIFSLKTRSRRDLRLLVLFSMLYFGFYRLGCTCAVGSIQNVALALGPTGYRLPVAIAAIFAIPLLFALFFGRVFCAAACPLGAIQDLVVLRPRQTPRWLDHGLATLPYIVLGAGVLFAVTGSAFLVCQYDPFVPLFRMSGPWYMLVAGGALLLLGTVIGRPFCRYLCPYGVLLRWASTLARWRVRITPAACIQCHLCADACPFGAIDPPMPDAGPAARSAARAGLLRLVWITPLALVLGGAAGWFAGPAMARIDRTVRTADMVWANRDRAVPVITDEVTAWKFRGHRDAELYATATAIRNRLRLGSTLLGLWIALVIVGRLAALYRRRSQTDYEADVGSCLSCARCYVSCPVEQERLGTGGTA